MAKRAFGAVVSRGILCNEHTSSHTTTAPAGRTKHRQVCGLNHKRHAQHEAIIETVDCHSFEVKENMSTQTNS